MKGTRKLKGEKKSSIISLLKKSLPENQHTTALPDSKRNMAMTMRMLMTVNYSEG